MINKIINLEKIKEYLYIRAMQLPDFYEGMKKAYILRSFLLFFLGSWLLPSFKYKNARYLIASVRHIPLIEKNKRHELVLLGGVIEFFFAIKNGCGYINTTNLYIVLTWNVFLKIKTTRLLNNLSEKLTKKFNDIENLNYLILDSDGLPYKRTLCIILQFLKKKVVCLQHGIFPDAYEGIDGTLCNLNIVIDENQKIVFLNSGLNESALVLLNEVTNEKNVSILYKNFQTKLVLVGEGWLSHDKERHFIYKAFLKKLKMNIKELNLCIVFRPHPSERFLFWTYWDLSPIECANRSKNIFPWNIYLGTTSSLLVDAVKKGAVAIQITDLLPITKSYEMYGVIQKKTTEIYEYINMINKENNNKNRNNRILNKKSITIDLDKIKKYL